MKTALLVLALVGLSPAFGLAQETSVEAPRTDQTWGQAQQSSWSKLLAYPQGRQPEGVPEGLQGTAAVELQKMYLKSFTEKPTKLPIFQLGVVRSQ